jgi:hypothetical protein
MATIKGKKYRRLKAPVSSLLFKIYAIGGLTRSYCSPVAGSYGSNL